MDVQPDGSDRLDLAGSRHGDTNRCAKANRLTRNLDTGFHPISPATHHQTKFANAAVAPAAIGNRHARRGNGPAT